MSELHVCPGVPQLVNMTGSDVHQAEMVENRWVPVVAVPLVLFGGTSETVRKRSEVEERFRKREHPL
ncbi:hypothetical protein [Streptomyces sp. MMBL 11-3]|uniref:hypothetical protein n=1 Tax=Streptomyces sp. MMBL 11-3 TaxID=3382639 RepID=UPI0039B63FD6